MPVPSRQSRTALEPPLSPAPLSLGLLSPAGLALTVLSLAVLSLTVLSLTGCQGDFARPTYDNPNDPAGGELPPTPSVVTVAVDCDTTATPPLLVGLDVTWTIDGESGIAEYQLFRSSSPAVDPGELILHVPAGTLTARDETVEEGVEYLYRVRAVDTDGRLGQRSAPRGAEASCE